MKVQTKITFLLGLVVAAFVGGLFAFHTYDRQKFRHIAEERFNERGSAFEGFLSHHGEPLQTLVDDFTCFDQMVKAIATEDYQWLGENVNKSTLDGYHAHTIWIHRADGTLLYPLSYSGAPEIEQFPISRESFAAIFAHQPLVHFFVEVPAGIMEIRAGTIHPSKDLRRQGPPQGYFFAGRLWNQPMLDEMSMFTGNEITLLPATQPMREIRSDEHNGSVAFSRVLRGWDGQPLAQLAIRNESPVVRQLNRESDLLFVSLILFALVLLLLISTFLVRWVRRPLGLIMTSLTHNDREKIASLENDNSEFGELARTVRKFFEQRDNLIREMDERRATEEALRKSEGELRHSQKMEAVGRLAGGVAHDFNNLLTAIIGYAELLTNRASKDPLVRQHADLIRKAGEQAATLTRQLLAFSRKQLLQPRVIDLNTLVVDMETLLRRVIGERFDLKTKPEAENGRVKADPNQLEQVILNLGVNARDAMPTGGTLIIRTTNVNLDTKSARQVSNALRPGSYVVLSVTDTGAGMNKETKAQIFEPFFTTKGPGKGTGLGLAMVYGIVRQSGGGISVESELSRGSTFRIYLPVETAPLDYVKPAPPPLRSEHDSETVLVVEDEEIVRELVCDVLEEQGYTVMRAADGQQALEMADAFEDKIDLLITDVIMPHMNGQELAVTLSRARPEMRVLYVSGYSSDDISDHGVLREDVELLQKPFSPHMLLERMREILGNGTGLPDTESDVTDLSCRHGASVGYKGLGRVDRKFQP
ncbi:MAG: response regulator [Verrucomicrobiota bacterium]|nr:response regulator [Verrucomicrobiota bacterium]